MRHLTEQARIGHGSEIVEHWYGFIDGFGGNLLPYLYNTYSEALKAADELEGRIVIVATRLMVDDQACAAGMLGYARGSARADQ